MDPFTDMLRAFADGTVDILDLYAWYNEWANAMNPALVCRASELGTTLCSNAMQFIIMLTW